MKLKLGKKQIIMIALALVFVVAAAVLAITLLGIFGGGEEGALPPEEPAPEPIAAPLQYEVEGDSIVALPVGSTVVVYGEEVDPFTLPEDEEEPIEGEDLAADGESDAESGEETEGDAAAEESEEGSEEEAEEPVIITLYRYENLPDDTRVQDYCTLLTAEDFGFTPVDENMLETELPDFASTLTGSVHLVRRIMENVETTETVTNEEGEEEEVTTITETKTPYLLSLRVEWGDGWCTVIPEAWEGSIAQPEPEPPATPATGASMTLMEAIDYMKGLHPEELGLAGDSMENYTIYALDGSAMVNGTPCLRLNIYGSTDLDTNTLAGQYFLTADGQHIYRLTDAGKVVLVK